jgi:hypothetical protein
MIVVVGMVVVEEEEEEEEEVEVEVGVDLASHAILNFEVCLGNIFFLYKRFRAINRHCPSKNYPSCIWFALVSFQVTWI